MLLSTLRLAASLIGVKYEMSKNKGIMLCVENTNQNRERRSSVDLTPFITLRLTSSAEMSPYGNLILGFVVCCWLFSIVDAYRIGKRMEHSENNQGSGGSTPWQR